MSGQNQFALLGLRRFAPFFATQALGAFNDNAFRNALIVLVGFHMGLPESAVGFYSNIAPALFIVPFFLFSATAGQLAEKFEKTRIIRFVKLFEIAAMALASIAFYRHSLWLMLTVLFLMGLHSTLFGPIKYAILPQALHPRRARRRQRARRDRHVARDPDRHDRRRLGDGERGTGRGVDPRARDRGGRLLRVPRDPAGASDGAGSEVQLESVHRDRAACSAS